MLKTIIDYKKEEIRKRKSAPANYVLDVAHTPRPFIPALKEHNTAIIAEIKKASPSKGLLCKSFDVKSIAEAYEKAGAACLSILTDEHFFQGSDQYLIEGRESVGIPVLRKDFIIDEFQVYETQALGADAILLIVNALDNIQLEDYFSLSTELGLTALIECHDEKEVERALCLEPTLLGINNRDLNTFTTNINTTLRLMKYIPDSITVVSESGISSKQEINDLKNHGVSAFLIGETFMRSPSPGNILSNML